MDSLVWVIIKIAYQEANMNYNHMMMMQPAARYGNARRRRPIYLSLFSSYWHQNAGVIEIQTRQQLKNNLFHEIQRIFVNKICIWTPSVYAVYSNRRPPSLFDEHCKI